MHNLEQHHIDAVLLYAEMNMNQLATARMMGKYHTTVSRIFDTVQTRTGLDPRNFYDLTRLIELINKEDDVV
jgi:hypothetical protein